jgi:hypothetical protein
MVLDPAAEDREPISPELVLVSSPEEAQRAREQLPELPGLAFAARAVPAAAPAAPPPPDAPPPTIERPPPPPYPRIPVNELLPDRPPRRKRGLVVLAACLVGAALAAEGYLAETRWHDNSATPAAAAPPAPTSTVAGPASVPSANPVTTAPKAASHPAPTATRPIATTVKSAPAKKAVPAKKPVPLTKTVPVKKTAPAKKAPPVTKTVPTKKAVPAKKAVRSAKPVAKSPRPAGFIPARTWAWVPSQGGGGYEVTFFLDGRTVLHSWPKEPRLVLPKGFRYHPGHYRWTVRAVGGAAKAKLIVDGNFVLTPAAAAAANA